MGTSKLPKILHIETGKNLYGGAKQVYYLLKGLYEKKYGENILICPKDSVISQECQNVCRIYSPKISGELDIFFLFKLIQIIAREKPNIIHIHSRRGADVWGPIAAKLTKTKCILTRRVDNPENKLIAKIKCNSINRIITISNGILKVLLNQGIDRKKIQVIPSAVDFEFYNKDCRRDWFYQKFDIPPDYKKIGMIAQFIPRKGHKFLISIVPEILKDFPKTVFLLFGKGPLLNEINNLIDKNDLKNHVKILGFRKDIDNILPCLDIVVHPAFMEGLGVSLLQASAAGVPIVASMVGGIPEVVRHGENGLLFPPGDKTGFIKNISSILSNHQFAHKLGQQGKYIVKKYFSIENMVDKYIHIYNEISI